MLVSSYVKVLCVLFISVTIATRVQGHPPITQNDTEAAVTEQEMQVSLVHGSSVTERRVTADFRTYDNGADDPWTLVSESDPIDPRFWPTVGNGHVATVVYSDTVFMNGLYNGNGTESMRARIPAMTAVNVQSISPAETSKLYILQLKKGIFIQQFKGENWTVHLQTYAHRTKTRLLVTTVTIETKAALATDLVIQLSVNHGDLESNAVDLTNGTSNITDTSYIFGRQKIPETPTSERVPVHMYYSNIPENLTVSAGDPVHNHKHLFLATISPFEEEARANFLQGVEAFQSDTLEQTHIEGWKQVWETGRIDLEGNITLASSVYSALYYILSAMPTVEETTWPFIGLSPEDLAHGNIEWIQYGGHVFWDQETWMYPTILALHSKLGKTLVGTRIRTLDSAYEYAKQRGYRGAMYPWESAFVGLNVSPGGRWAKYEMHISGDIAFAFKQYLMMTEDTDMLSEGRLSEAILGIAEFWRSRSTLNQSRGLYDILDVMPPDEWHYPVNNSAFTNAVAKISLLLPKYAEGLLGKHAPKIYEDMANHMYIPNDKENNYHPEYDGFTLNDTVKQADVVLMGYPLMVEMTEEERKNDLTIYERLTGEGPAMTWSMFAIGWLEFGETEKAMDLFYKQLKNKKGPFNVWTELADGSGATNFITGMGGYLQSVLFGYGGLRMYTDRIDFSCTPVPDTTGFTIRGLDYFGSSLNIHTTVESVSVTLIQEGPVKLYLFLYKTAKSERLTLQHTITVPRQKFSIRRNGVSKFPSVSTVPMTFALLCYKIFLFICFL